MCACVRRVQGPDSKVIKRLLTKMEQSGKAKLIPFTVPNSYQNGELRTVSCGRSLWNGRRPDARLQGPALWTQGSSAR